jgi:hypothetical protein
MNRKPLINKTSVRLFLLGLVLALSLMPSGAAPTAKADSIGDCGAPYTRYNMVTYWIPTTSGLIPVPWFETQACADCDGGTYCYAAY